MKNQRLAWFLIGNLIGLGGLLLVVLVSDAFRRSAQEVSPTPTVITEPAKADSPEAKPASKTEKAKDAQGG